MVTISLKKTRDFIYQNGLLWERALFAWLFERGSLHHLYQCLRCYKNMDGGYGHGLEPDIRTPESHPLALEYLLFILVFYQIPPEDLLFGTAKWVVDQQNEDGSFKNPDSIKDYPHAAWWANGGQHIPLSIVGLLHFFGRTSSEMLERTSKWAQANYSIERIENNDWLFAAYHAVNYFFNIDQYPDLAKYQDATVDNIRTLLEARPDKGSEALFQLAPFPDSLIMLALPDELIQRELDRLLDTYLDNGGWHDEHNLPHWYVGATIANLTTLQRHERINLLDD